MGAPAVYLSCVGPVVNVKVANPLPVDAVALTCAIRVPLSKKSTLPAVGDAVPLPAVTVAMSVTGVPYVVVPEGVLTAVVVDAVTGAVTVMEYDRLAVSPVSLVAVTVNVYVAGDAVTFALVSWPFVAFKLTPAGKLPAVTANVGDAAPDAVIVWLYELPCARPGVLRSPS